LAQPVQVVAYDYLGIVEFRKGNQDEATQAVAALPRLLPNLGGAA